MWLGCPKDTQHFQNSKRTPQGWHALTEASQHCRAQKRVSQKSLVSLHTVSSADQGHAAFPDQQAGKRPCASAEGHATLTEQEPRKRPCASAEGHATFPEQLHLVTIIAVLWVRADHNVWDFGPVDNQREHCMRSIVVSKPSPAHAADTVSDQRCDPPLWPLWEQTIHQKCC